MEIFSIPQGAKDSGHSQPDQELSKLKLVVKLMYRPIASRPPIKPPIYTKIPTGLEIFFGVVVKSLDFVGVEGCGVTTS